MSDPAPPISRTARPTRSWLVLGVAALAIAFTFWFLNRRQPLADWVFWRFAGIYALVLFFGLACLCAGHALLAWPCRSDRMPPGERLLLDMAAGVLVFALGTFLVGVAHGLGHAYFWLLPSVLIAVGAPLLVRDGPAILFELRRSRARVREAPSLAATLAVGFGTVGILLVYLPILTPENIAFDARWYHLPIAEHYLAAGRIAAFPEGWHLGAIPHLASWLYTWALASPVFDLHGRVELAAHLEFFLFLLTLAATPLLVVRLTGAKHARGTWAVFFLFPGLFLYDSSLATAADHVLAFWAAPVALAALWFVSAFTARRALVLAVACAGAALTKTQSAYLLMPTVLFVVGCGAIRVGKRKDPIARVCFVLALPLLGAFLLLTASYWLANAIWYGNPVYPLLADVFPSRPWRTFLPGKMFDEGWAPGGTLWMRLGKTLLAPFTFAYLPHDWYMFHRDLPVFGFLFTLGLAILPFLRHTRRIWVLGAGTLLGVTIWFWTYHQDRYLQALLPWMVATTAAIVLRAWRTGLAARIGVVGLVALQLVWSGDIPFLPARLADGRTSIEHAIRLLSSTYRNDIKHRFDAHTGYDKVAAALPAGSVVLLHLKQFRLGIGHPVVTDNPRWTGAPLLGSLAGPSAAWQQLRDWGVTHILFTGNVCDPADLDLQSELATHYLAYYASAGVQNVDGKTIVTLATSQPEQAAFPDVLYAGCSKRARIPWHSLDETYAADRFSSTPAGDLPEVDQRLLAGLHAAVVDDRCSIQFPPAVASHWKKVAQWKEAQLWLRQER